jgi:hypothetical protein
MALTISLTGDWMHSIGDLKAVHGIVTFDNSYASGGESLTAANVGLQKILFMSLNQGEDGYVYKYDYTNSKVLAYVSKDPAAAGGADIVLQEAGAIDLSAAVVNFFAIGY